MRKGNSIYGIIAVLLLSLGACSLIHDDMEELGYREDGSAYAYVSLTIHTGTAGNVTRANPTGGETGNGYEDGQTYENAVKDLTLFFYPATLGDGGVNRKGNIDFTAKVYIDQMGTSTDGTQPIDKTYTVGPVKVNGLKMNQQYHVLAVANAGNQTDIASLEALRSETVSTVYTATTTDNKTSYSNFVMASEGDEDPVLDIKYDNSKNNPATTSINMERLVARVDYKTIDNNVYQLSSSLITPGLNPAQSSPAQQVTAGVSSRADAQVTASITRAFLVNTYNQDRETFVLKRVADTWDAITFNYLGNETLNNYVIDPLTAQKESSKYAFSWYDHYFPNLSDEVGIDGKTEWEDWLTEGDPITITITESGKTETWYRLGYPKENTSSIGAQGKYFSTGVVFEAQYDLTGITGFTKEATFFRVNGNLYPTLEEAMEGFDTDFDENKTFSSYSNVSTYVNSLTNNGKSNDDPAGYIDYLKTATAEDFVEGSVWTWSYYKQNVLFFNASNQATAKTREALHDRGHGTETFLNGRGYYTYWIRHNYGDKDDAVPGLPMENAIVRNNIYKLTVTSISEIGNDVPGETSLDILVAVAKWTMMDEENWVLVPVKEE